MVNRSSRDLICEIEPAGLHDSEDVFFFNSLGELTRMDFYANHLTSAIGKSFPKAFNDLVLKALDIDFKDLRYRNLFLRDQLIPRHDMDKITWQILMDIGFNQSAFYRLNIDFFLKD